MSWSRENWSCEHWFRESWSQETKSNIDYNWSSVVTRWNPFTFLIWWLVYELHSGLQNWHMQYMRVANPQDEFYNTSGIRYEHNILTSSLAWCNHFREFGHEIETRVRVRVRTGTGGVDLGTRSDSPFELRREERVRLAALLDSLSDDSVPLITTYPENHHDDDCRRCHETSLLRRGGF